MAESAMIEATRLRAYLQEKITVNKRIRDAQTERDMRYALADGALDAYHLVLDFVEWLVRERADAYWREAHARMDRAIEDDQRSDERAAGTVDPVLLRVLNDEVADDERW